MVILPNMGFCADRSKSLGRRFRRMGFFDWKGGIKAEVERIFSIHSIFHSIMRDQTLVSVFLLSMQCVTFYSTGGSLTEGVTEKALLFFVMFFVSLLL